MNCYIDTSVLAAYYCPEPLSRQVQNFLVDRNNKLAVSRLTEVELFSAISRKVRMQEMGKADGNRILAKFSSHMNAQLFTVVPVERNHWQLARGWIALFSAPLRTLDALHLAITSAENFELVTADNHLYQAAGLLDVPARLMKESDI